MGHHETAGGRGPNHPHASHQGRTRPIWAGWTTYLPWWLRQLCAKSGIFKPAVRARRRDPQFLSPLIDTKKLLTTTERLPQKKCRGNMRNGVANDPRERCPGRDPKTHVRFFVGTVGTAAKKMCKSMICIEKGVPTTRWGHDATRWGQWGQVARNSGQCTACTCGQGQACAPCLAVVVLTMHVGIQAPCALVLLNAKCVREGAHPAGPPGPASSAIRSHTDICQR